MTRLFPTFVAIVLLALSLAHAADTAPAPADTEATPSPTPALTAAALYDDALGHFHARDDDAARALFARIVAEFPASDETRDAIYKLGEIHYRAGQTGDAAGYYALYIDRWPAAPNARDAKTRLAMCQDSGAAAVAAPIALAETPIRHIALVADALPFGDASALHAALVPLRAGGATTLIAHGLVSAGAPPHALAREPATREGAFFATDAAPLVADLAPELSRVARTAQLRFGWYLETLDAAFLAAGDDAFDGRFSLSSRVVESTRRLDPFSDAVAESIARVAADAALSGASLLVISGLTLAPEQGFSASAREAFASPANASADPASMFGATIVEDGAATPERLEPYAAYAEHKAARLAEIVRRAVEAAKKANAGVRVFVEVPAMAVLDPADGLARFGVDAEAMLAAGADGLFIRATWRPASPEAVPDGEKTEWLSGLAARALELAPDPKDIVIAIPVADARTRKPYPDWEVRRAIDAALGGVPCGVALFPLVSDIPYNRVFAPIAKTRQPESP